MGICLPGWYLHASLLGNVPSPFYANYPSSGFNQTRDIGHYPSNQWGFYDMSGNVFEWVNDWRTSYSANSVVDPEGPSSSSQRVFRGGAFSQLVAILRATARPGNIPSYSTNWLGFRLALRQVSLPPSNLASISSLTIAENQPIGTIVGEFNATDSDAGAILTYHLVSGGRDTDNSLFALETNGTLRTATTFDYETNASTYAIRVEARDEYNATVEGNFTVQLVNNPSDDLDFRGRDISSLNLSNQDLSSAQFDNTTIFSDGVNGVNFVQYFGNRRKPDVYQLASNSQPDLRGVNLTGVRLWGSGIGQSGALFDRTTTFSNGVVGAYLDDANLSNLDLSGVDFRGVYLCGPSGAVDFSDSNLTGAIFDDTTEFSEGGDGVDFSGTNLDLSNLDFSNMDTVGWNYGFKGANLSSVNLSNANLMGVAFDTFTIFF